MESEKFISVCDNSSGSPQVFIVDLASGNPPTVTKRPMSAEAAIMNPVSKVLALRGTFPPREPRFPPFFTL